MTNRYKAKIQRTILLLFVLLSQVKSQNKYPIVLVHGFMGWGPEEMGSYNYWGGKYDLIKEILALCISVYIDLGPN